MALVTLFLALVVPLIINRTTEHLPHLIRRWHLRGLWMLTLCVLSIYLLWDQKETLMKTHQALPHNAGWIGLAFSGFAGAVLFMAFWWMTGNLLKPRMELTFSDSPQWTSSRKRFVATEFAAFRDYLVGLGFTPPSHTPPVQIGEHDFMIGSPSEYGFTLSMAKTTVNDRMAVRSAYASYVFYSLMHTTQTDLSKEPNRWAAASFFAEYFISSFSDTDISNKKSWATVLWRVRNETSPEFMDHAMFYSVQLFDETRADPKGDFDEYFRSHVVRGLLVMENPGASWHKKLDIAIQEVFGSPEQSLPSDLPPNHK